MRENLLSGGSADNKLATYVAEASNPSRSSLASSERSVTSHPKLTINDKEQN